MNPMSSCFIHAKERHQLGHLLHHLMGGPVTLMAYNAGSPILWVVVDHVPTTILQQAIAALAPN